jgi:hypothetical protein
MEQLNRTLNVDYRDFYTHSFYGIAVVKENPFVLLYAISFDCDYVYSCVTFV